MRNLQVGRIVLGALAVALRNPPNAVRADFAKALKCVQALIDFRLMAQYGSHTTSTLEYLENDLKDFHIHKNIFLELRAYKRTRKDAKDRTRALQSQGSQGNDRSLQEIREIRERSHFNFIKLHLLSHYRERVERFGSIPMFSTDISELAHVHQVKEAYEASNKADAATQILDYCGRRLALEMRILNLKDIVGCSESNDDLLWNHRENLKELLHILKIEDRKTSTNDERALIDAKLPLRKLCNPLARSQKLYDIADELKMNRTALYHLVKEYAEDENCSQSFIGSLESFGEYRGERFTCLQVPIPIFQKPDMYEIHNPLCTGEAAFRKRAVRKDWAWVSVASSEHWGVFGGCLSGRLETLFKLRDDRGRPHRLCLIEILEAKVREIPDTSHGLPKACRKRRRKMWVVNIRSILGMAHLFEVDSSNWLVNTRIDLRTWNDFS